MPRRGLYLCVALIALVMTLAMGAFASSALADGTIVATKGGDRSASNAVSGATTYASGVAGATFEYTAQDPTQPASVWTAFPAATAVNGQASVTVPNGTYYVREKTAGTGYSNYGPVQQLSYNGSHPYVARVTVQQNQTTYAFPHSNTNSTPANWTPTNTGSATNNGSPFINVRDNGTLPPGCGTNILLVLDRSGSIEPFKDDYEAAAKEFVNKLNGTPTQIGIVSFNNAVNSYQPATGDSNFYNAPLSLSNASSAATLNGTIEDIYDNPENLTNWDGVLQAASAAKSFTPNASTGQTANPDMVVFITDGNPTTSQASTSGSNEDLINLTSGMASANLVKNQASRAGQKVKLLAIGVGNGVTIENLKAVSGPDEGVDGDYAAPTVAELGDFLSELAASQCGARVYVRKRLTGNNTNQAGWFYTAVDPRPGFTPTYQDGNRATHSSGNPPVIETGAFFNTLPATATTVNINEDAGGQPLASFDLTDVQCRKDSYDGGTVVAGQRTGLNYALPVNRGDSVYCTFTNTPRTTLTINKTPDNAFVSAGDDAEFTMVVTNTGASTAINPTVTDALPAPGVGGWTVSQQPAGGNCNLAANNLSCTLANLAPGASVTIKVKTGTSFAACGVYDNPTATAQASNAPPVSNAGKITCQKPNVTINKTAVDTSIDAGEDAQFSIVVNNAGPGTAKGVTINDPLPSGTAGSWTIVTNPGGCSIAANTLTCNFGDLASGASRTVTVKSPTSNQACTVYNNTATVSATNHPNAADDATVTCNKPGLGVIKTSVQASISAGDNAQFEIKVSNTGPGTALGVTLNDPLPSGTSGPWTILSQPGGAPCSITAGTLNCNFGDLPAGADRTVTVTAPTNFQNCSTLVNLATASATNSPSATDDATINCNKPNLSVLKTTPDATIDAGEDVQFSIVVSNAGPGTAKGVALSDPLPAGTSGAWTIVTNPGGCSIAANTLSCNFGDLASGATRTVTVKAPTSFQNCTVYNNTATATATNAPSANDAETVNCSKPNLSVVKTGNGPVNAGEDVEFEIQVTNSGPGTAKAVSLTDSLPSGAAGAWVISSQPGSNPCGIAGSTLSCNFNDIPAGQTITVKVKAPTSFQACTVYDNTATASSTNHPNASDGAVVTCNKPNLSVDKSTPAATISAGEDVQFSIKVSNAGPGIAEDVTLSDPLPGGVAGVWSIVSQPGGAPCTIVGSNLNCNFGDLPAAASVTVTVKASTNFQNCAVYNNTASVSSTNFPDSSDAAQVTCQKPNLKIVKTGNGPINAGQDIEFAIQVTNDGPGTAKAVTLNDPLPTAAAAWQISQQPGSTPCTILAGVLNCNFGDMPAGATVTVKVKAPTNDDACRVFDNTGTASATNSPNVSDDASVLCNRGDLGVLKTSVQPTISAGDNAQFSITVSSTGDGTATGVTLDDPLPTGVAGAWTITDQPDGDPCTIVANTLECDFGDMAPGTSHTVTVSAPTNFENCSVLNNTATASSTNTPDASDDASITCNKPDLDITKTGNGTINAGEDAQFTIEVKSNGPGTAKTVELHDPLPAGTAGGWTITQQPGGTPCVIASNTLNCDFGDMPAGATVTVVIKAATNAQACAVYDNTATVGAFNAPNVSDDASINCQKPDLSVEKTATNETINAGEDAEFSIVVSNDGPGTAKGVKLNDPLPTGTAGAWTIDSQPDGDPCSIVANTLSCDFGDLPADTTLTVTVKAPTNHENCTVYDNTATATSTNAPNATDDATVTCKKGGLGVLKTSVQATISAGDNAEFSITVSSTGDGTAKGVTLDDPLPGGVSGAWTITSQPDGDPCSIVANTLECDFGDMAPGTEYTVEVSAPTDFESCSVLDNTATASSTNTPDASDDASIDCQKPDITVSKTAEDETISAGEDVQFTIVVTSNGPGTAKGVVLKDPLPAGVAGDWTIVSQPDGDPCEIVDDELNCDFGDMPGDSSKEVVVKAATDFANCTEYDNTANVESDNHPAVSDEAAVECQKPNLVVTKTGNGPINAGQNIEFTVGVKNNGPGVANSVKLADPLPGGGSLAWTIKAQPGGNPCAIAAGVLNCDFGDLAAGATASVTVSAPTSMQQCSTYDNTATAAGTNHPPVTGAASVTCSTATLSLLKTGNGTVEAGQDVVYKLELTNNGPGIAIDTKLDDPLPNNLATAWSISSQPSGSPCSIANRTLHCDYGDLAVGAKASVTIKAGTSGSKCTTYKNTATGVAIDANPVSSSATVNCLDPNVLLRKSANKKKVFPGDEVRYKISIRNEVKGTVAKNLKVCDKLPTQMSLVTRGGGFLDEGRLCWNVKQLPYSKSWKSFSYVARVDADANPGSRLKNVVTLGNKKATRTVIVKKPQEVSPARRTPVTG